MNQITSIKDRLNRMLHGDVWHGDSVKELIEDLTPEQAARHPIEGAHSIWELVHHMTCWHRVVKRRLRGEDYDPDDADNWAPVLQINSATWEAAKKDLYQSAEELMIELDSKDTTDLDTIVPGQSYSVGFMLNGLIEHDAYHAGQIAMLRKFRAKPVGS